MNAPLEAAIKALADLYDILDSDPYDPRPALACIHAFIAHPQLSISDECRKTMRAHLEEMR